MRNTALRSSTVVFIFLLSSAWAQLPGAPPESAVTKEPITLRGIEFDKGNTRNLLTVICKADAARAGFNLNESAIPYCDPTQYALLMPRFQFGNLRAPTARAWFSQSGALVRFAHGGDPQEMLQLAKLLEEKYGPPTVLNSEVRNGLGQPFPKRTFLWKDQAGTALRVETLYARVDKGQVVIEAKSLQIEQQQDNSARDAKHKSKL